MAADESSTEGKSRLIVNVQAYPVPIPSVQGRVLNNEAVVVLPEKGEVKVLNEVGALIWSLADGRHSIHEIAEIVATEYAVTLAEAESDTLAFITELQAKGVISVEDRGR